MTGLLARCQEHRVPLRLCIRKVLGLDPAKRVGIVDWCLFMKEITGDKGCTIWVKKTTEDNAQRCERPAMSWTRTPWGCACTARVCKKHSRRRRLGEKACVCPDRPPTVGRPGGFGEPSPWQENAIRIMEDGA